MKNFVLVIAFALLATVSASAAEVPQACPAMSIEQQTPEAIPLAFGPIQLIPRCYAVNGTSCPTNGATRACTDACNNNLSCTCYSHFWYCNQEC